MEEVHVNDAHCYAVLADEVTFHNTEHLAICSRFVDKKLKCQRRVPDLCLAIENNM